MKKILLLCAAAFTFFAADAQTKKKSKKAKKPNKEAVAKARFEKQEVEKGLARRAYIDSLRIDDSTRIVNDNLADLQKDSLRNVYRESGLKQIDSTNKESYLSRMNQRNAWDKSAKTNADVAKAAKLSDYQARQVQYINQEYNAKARAIAGTDAAPQQQQLAALNAERREKIKAIVGKARERKLEKERKEYVQKNGADADSQWVDIAESVASNK